MDGLIIDLAKIALPGLVVAIITSVITVRLSIRSFYAQKWWEKKHEVYTRLFEVLHHLKTYALEHLKSYEEHREIPDEKKTELEANWKIYSQEYKKIYDLSSFQLSNKTVSILEEYNRKKQEAVNIEDMYEWIDSDAAAVVDCIDKLSVEAKKDLKI